MKGRVILIASLGLVLMIFVDRFAFMPGLIDKKWSHGRSSCVVDPITSKPDFALRGSGIVLNGHRSRHGEGKKFLLIGCCCISHYREG